MKAIICLIAALALSACSLTDEGITTTAQNYVRLTEYSASVPLYGGVSGCQLSVEGKIESAYTLETANCSVSVSE